MDLDSIVNWYTVFTEFVFKVVALIVMFSFVKSKA